MGQGRVSLESLSKDRAIVRFCLFGIISVGLHICFLFSVGFFDCFQLPDLSTFALTHETPPPPGHSSVGEDENSDRPDKEAGKKENLANALSKEKDLPLLGDGQVTRSSAVAEMPTLEKGPQPINLVPNEKGKVLERSRWCAEPQWSPDGRYILTAVKSLNVSVQETTRNGRGALAIGAPRIFVNAVLLDAKTLKVIEQFNRGPFRGSFDWACERVSLRDVKYAEGKASHLFLYDLKTHRLDFLSSHALAGSLSPDGQRVFCLGANNVSVINVEKKKELTSTLTTDNYSGIAHSDFAWSPNGQYCAVIAGARAKGRRPFAIKVFDSQSLHLVATIPLGAWSAQAPDERVLAFLPDNKSLAYRSQHGFAVMDVQTKHIFVDKLASKFLPDSVSLSPDSSTLLFCDGAEAKAYSADDLTALFSIEMRLITKGPYSCSWSHDSNSVLFKTKDSVLIYNVREKAFNTPRPNVFGQARFGPDDKTIESYGGGFMASSSKI